jgi:hypothetical protein
MTSEWERRERKRKRRDTDNKDCGEECNTMDRFWRLLLVCFLWSSVVAQYVGRGRCESNWDAQSGVCLLAAAWVIWIHDVERNRLIFSDFWQA